VVVNRRIYLPIFLSFAVDLLHGEDGVDGKPVLAEVAGFADFAEAVLGVDGRFDSTEV
jgi:hypothetical protein